MGYSLVNIVGTSHKNKKRRGEKEMENYDYSVQYTLAQMGWGPIIAISFIVWVVNAFFLIKVFEKAGEYKWAAFIPLYNVYMLYKISWGNGWLFLLTLIPCVGLVVDIIMQIKLAYAFGKGVGYALLLVFLTPIGYGLLAFDKDVKYIGPQ